MQTGAPRLLARLWHRLARGAVLTICLWVPGQSLSADISRQAKAAGYTAQFEAPTHRYGHAIMGDLPEWGRLCLEGDGVRACVTLPESSVFEDMAPRLSDVDVDGKPEAVVVESSTQAGAALVVYKLSATGLVRVSTPPIGTRNRWLAPAAIADLDGDGLIELAYIDRPHLAKRLRIWRYDGGVLVHVADADGLTNHRIGEPFMSGGLRICDAGPEIITASADWSRIIASRLTKDAKIVQNDLGPFSKVALQDILHCR